MARRMETWARRKLLPAQQSPKPAGAGGLLASTVPLVAMALMVVPVSSSAGAEEMTEDEVPSVEEKKSAVDLALGWLLEHQLDDGGWSFDLGACPKCQGKCSHSGVADAHKDRVAATSRALLPFLARGYTHSQGPYKKQLEGGIAFLAAKVLTGDGKVYGEGGTMESQGLAALILSECYAMSQDQRLAKPAQMALDAIMAAQDQRSGGWSRNPGEPCDTSTFGWQIMALKSGNMAYLDIDAAGIEKAKEFLDSVQSDSGATYASTNNAIPDPASSAVGLLCRMSMGWKRKNPVIQDGVARIAKLGPTDDLVYGYFGTLVLQNSVDGEQWVEWRNKMKKLLLATQATEGHEAGSWYEGVNGGNATRGGRLGYTALATTILTAQRDLPRMCRDENIDDEFRE